MSRLTIEVSSEQHQHIKVMAAMRGQSIKEYIINRVFNEKNEEEEKEEAAWKKLMLLLEVRIAEVREQGVSRKTVQQITEEALASLGKA